MPGEPQELVQLGPFGGLDVTTDVTTIPILPGQQGGKRGIDGSGYVLNRAYGAYTTTKARRRLASLPFPRTNGLTEFTLDPTTPRYLAAGDSGIPLVGTIFAFNSLGVLTQLATPFTLSTGQQTNFEEYGQWSFMSNGLDTPLKVDTSLSVTNWGVVAPTLAVMATLGSSGSISAVNPFFYAQTWGNDVQESSPSPLFGLVGVVASTSRIIMTASPSSDPQVTEVNFYRLGGDSGQAGTWRFVGAVSNSAVLFTDNTADGLLTGAQLVQHRDPPQPFLSITSHKDRMIGIGYNGTAVGEAPGTPATSDVWIGNAFEPWGFDNVNGILPCGRNAGDDIAQGGQSLGGVLLIGKRKSIWVITGNSLADFFAEQLFEIGCANGRTIVYALGQWFWLAFDTVYTFAGGSYTDIGAQLKDFFFNLDDDDRAAACGGFYDKTYLISFPTLGLTWGYDLRAAEWVKYPWAFDQCTFDPEGPIELDEAGGDDTPLLLLGSELNSGNIDLWFAEETDLGASLNTFFLSPISDCGAKQYTKQFNYGVAVIQPVDPTKTARVKITVTTDPGTPMQVATPVEINVAATNFRNYTFSLPENCSGRFVQVRIDVTSSQRVQIASLSLYGNSNQRFAVNVSP